MDSSIDRLLRRNDAYEHPDTGDPGPEPGHRVAILTCMDWRVQPSVFLGLDANEAHVLRNAGGIVTDDVLRSLALSQSLLGTREVMIIMHTACGLQADERTLREQVADSTSTTPGIRFGGFDDLESTLCASMDKVRTTPWILHRDRVRGFVFELRTGKLREVSS